MFSWKTAGSLALALLLLVALIFVTLLAAMLWLLSLPFRGFFGKGARDTFVGTLAADATRALLSRLWRGGRGR